MRIDYIIAADTVELRDKVNAALEKGWNVIGQFQYVAAPVMHRVDKESGEHDIITGPPTGKMNKPGEYFTAPLGLVQMMARWDK